MATTIESAGADRICAVIAAAAAVLTFVESPKPAWTVLLVVVALVPWALVLARREPPAWLFLVLGVLPVVPIVITSSVGVVLFMTTAVASRFASRTDGRAAVVAVSVAIAAVPFTAAILPPHVLNGAGYFAFGDAFGVLVGVLLRRADRLAEQLREADADLAAARQREDRQRIARDVHDLVAHSLTVVVLHIGGARRVLRADPAAAESALADAERVCRESLDGIRGVVGLLRDEGASAGMSLDLQDLAETYRAAGLPLELEVRGEEADLPLATRVALYRVVQEALANAARHMPAGGAVTASVGIDADGVAARIANPREAQQRPPGAGGFGLPGLREQVAGAEGELTSGPSGEDWVVTCRLPVRRLATAAGDA